MKCALVGAAGLAGFHIYHDAHAAAHSDPAHPPARSEHAPELEPVAGLDTPGLYSVAAPTTTTSTTTTTTQSTSTTTRPPGVGRDHIPRPPARPQPGHIVAWNEARQTWGEIIDCGFSGSVRLV